MSVTQAGPDAVNPYLNAGITHLLQQALYLLVVFADAAFYGNRMDGDKIIDILLSILGIQIYNGHIDDLVEDSTVLLLHFF